VTVWNWVTRKRTDRGWPGYFINGRIRTSTAALILAFFVLSWVHNTYQPQPAAPAQQTQVVPPGFVPDPDYTWVPRTQVEQAPRTVYRTVTPTPTTTTETETPTETTTPTSPGETTSSTPTSPGEPPTTVVDPDGPGPLSPTTITGTPTPTGATTVPNRSGVPTPAPTTTGVPAPGPATTPAPLAQ
jgi:hypothetical protein